MKRIGAFVLALIGALGLVTVPLFEFSPSGLEKWVVIGAALLVLIGFALFERWKPAKPEPELEPYLRNPARRRHRQWTATRKLLRVAVPSGEETRREASLRLELRVRNRSRKPLTRIRLPLGGDALVRGADLRLSTEVGNQVVKAQVEDKEGYSPIVDIPLPYPGIAHAGEIDLALRWSWPGMVRMQGGTWILGLIEVDNGCDAWLQVDYPAADPQHAQVRIVRSLGPLKWDQPQGALSPVETSGGRRYEFKRRRSRFDSYIGLETEAT